MGETFANVASAIGLTASKLCVGNTVLGVNGAGVTKAVIDHAKSIMHSLEEDSKNRDTNEMLLNSAKKNVTAQVSLFDSEASKIEQQIRDIDVDNLTPLQALTVLCDLKKQLDE